MEIRETSRAVGETNRQTAYSRRYGDAVSRCQSWENETAVETVCRQPVHLAFDLRGRLFNAWSEDGAENERRGWLRDDAVILRASASFPAQWPRDHSGGSVSHERRDMTTGSLVARNAINAAHRLTIMSRIVIFCHRRGNGEWTETMAEVQLRSVVSFLWSRGGERSSFGQKVKI